MNESSGIITIPAGTGRSGNRKFLVLADSALENELAVLYAEQPPNSNASKTGIANPERRERRIIK